MPTPATEIEVAGTPVRVTSPDRVIFPTTDATPEATKLDVVTYYASVGDEIFRALRHRPTTLERWPKGVHPGIKLATRQVGDGDAFYQKRVPKGAPAYVETAADRVPVGPTRRRGLSDRACRRGVGGADRHHRRSTRGRSVATTSTTLTSCGSTSTRSRAPTSTTPIDAAMEARALLDELGIVGLPEDIGQPRHPHLHPDRAALGLHRRPACRDRLRSGAVGPDA